MFCGTILLTEDNYYVDEFGNLPDRPAHDKTLLKEMLRGQTVSEEGYDMLPPSMRRQVRTSGEPTYPVTIKELAECQLLIISRSPGTITNGRKFRLDAFTPVFKDTKIEIWSRDELR